MPQIIKVSTGTGPALPSSMMKLLSLYLSRSYCSVTVDRDNVSRRTSGKDVAAILDGMDAIDRMAAHELARAIVCYLDTPNDTTRQALTTTKDS